MPDKKWKNGATLRKFDRRRRSIGQKSPPAETNLLSVVTDAGGDPYAKDQNVSVIGTLRANESPYVFTHCPKHPNCEVWRMTKTTHARQMQTQTSETCRWYLTSNINRSPGRSHRVRRILVVLVTELSYKKQRCTRNNTVLKEILASSSEARHDVHRHSQLFIKACPDPQWMLDKNTPHRSENKGIAERSFRRVKDGTATAMVQHGLPDSWWDCAMECHCHLRRSARHGGWQDSMRDNMWCKHQWAFDNVRSQIQLQTHLFERRVTAAPTC